MVGFLHQLNGHEFERTLGNGEGRGGLVCCSPCCEESDMTQLLNMFDEVNEFRLSAKNGVWKKFNSVSVEC